MNETTITERLSDQGGLYERAPYLTTFRALGACTRELARLTDALVDGVEALRATLDTPAPVVRRPPGRCLVQLGPVALTAVWLRSSPDSAATGQLLINVWRGAVAPRMQHRSERPGQERMPEPATLLWESVLIADAATEAAWSWAPETADAPALDARALAATCVEQLRLAYVDTLSPQEPA